MVKKVLQILSVLAIALFAFLFIADKFNLFPGFNFSTIINSLVVFYLITSLRYFKIEVDEKNEEIQKLRLKLENNKTK